MTASAGRLGGRPASQARVAGGEEDTAVMEGEGPGSASSSPRTVAASNNDKGCFLVLASDGVWEFLSSQEVVNIVGGYLSLKSASGMNTGASISTAGAGHNGPSTVPCGGGGAKAWASSHKPLAASSLGHGMRSLMDRTSPGVGSDDPRQKDGKIGKDGCRPDLMAACEALVEASLSRWNDEYGGQYIDDITVVIAQIPKSTINSTA